MNTEDMDKRVSIVMACLIWGCG